MIKFHPELPVDTVVPEVAGAIFVPEPPAPFEFTECGRCIDGDATPPSGAVVEELASPPTASAAGSSSSAAGYEARKTKTPPPSELDLLYSNESAKALGKKKRID